MRNEKTMYVFRHGLATESKYGYGRKILTAEILPKGIPPIKKIGEYLKGKPIVYFASSPYIRCVQTATIIADITKKAFIKDDRLSEYSPHGKEPFDSAVKRVQSFLEDMEKNEQQHIALCTHGAIIGILLALLRNNETVLKKSVKEYPLTGVLTVIKGEKIETIDCNS